MKSCSYRVGEESRCLRFRREIDETICCKCSVATVPTNPDFPEKWTDPLIVLDRRREQTDSLRGLLAGGSASAFLACGGPSANDLKLERLAERGCWTMSVNNMAAHHRLRPQAFVCADPPSKFSDSIWLDPGVMKFVPTPKLKGRRGGLRRKNGDGTFERLELGITDCPNVWGFQRRSHLWPDDQFFINDGACWGNQDHGVRKTGERKTVCTMMLGIRLLYHLGVRTIYLVGVDFRMTQTNGYSFNQARTVDAVLSNNEHFEIVNEWLCKMQTEGTFERFGLEVYNCNPHSGLRAFPHVPFDTAVDRSKGSVQDRPDLSGWYDPRPKK